MASVVGICNRGLQKLGANRISSLTDENSKNARACNACYEDLRDAELRAHSWNFAIDRVSLAADSEAPTFGRTNAFQLPSDFLKLLEPYPEYNYNSIEWQVEGGKIYTDDTAPLNIRYIKKITNPDLMDPLFREALATKIAFELCEEITQSNTKKEALRQDYKMAISVARKANAIERVALILPEDEWLSARN